MQQKETVKPLHCAPAPERRARHHNRLRNNNKPGIVLWKERPCQGVPLPPITEIHTANTRQTTNFRYIWNHEAQTTTAVDCPQQQTHPSTRRHSCTCGFFSYQICFISTMLADSWMGSQLPGPSCQPSCGPCFLIKKIQFKKIISNLITQISVNIRQSKYKLKNTLN